MAQIKCPNCGSIITLNEQDYQSVAQQIRNAEFAKELETREKELAQLNAKEIELVKIQAAAEKQKDISLLQQQIEALKAQQTAAQEAIVSQKESEKQKTVSELLSQIEKLKGEKTSAVQAEQLAKEQAVSSLNTEIEKLKAKIAANEQEKQLVLTEFAAQNSKNISEKETEILTLKNEISTLKKDGELKEKSLKENYEIRLQEKDEALSFYKDLKSKLNTKMLGETLEQHCEISFNQWRSAAFANSYFEKDNETKEGTKGDYIFRESKNGVEFISIMFEMKNESDDTAKKHKNEEFFAKLDKDRTKKNCEYAVLVSTLESDSEIYTGITDVSYKYPKMYVIRPQFFIPMITLLRSAAEHTLDYKTQLAEYKQQNIDITNFETELNDFKDKFGRNYRLASEKFNAAIEEIDKSIERLQKVKANLLSSENNLRLANDKAEDLSIKKLTKNNPTMAQKFAALKDSSQEDKA